MAANASLNADPMEQMKQLKQNKKQLQLDQKNQRKEAKKKAKELELQERELDEQIDGSGVPVAIVTVFIIAIWLGIIALLIKMDVGGFGSNVLAPIFKDVPVISMLLPSDTRTETGKNQTYGGYSSIKDAVEEIKKLELQIEQTQKNNATYIEQIELLKAEIERLKTFEDNQVEFQRVKEEFFEEVVYAQNGPGAEEYRKYYEEMDPTTAEILYKQVVATEITDKQMADYISTFSNMDAASAAKILSTMTDNLDLAAKVLAGMNASSRANILGNMDPAIAARIAKIMAPNH